LALSSPHDTAHLNLIVALLILLEQGSAVAAARRMHLNAPAISRTLVKQAHAVFTSGR